MVYTKNWIEKNMGITRKTIDTYEEHGFIHPARNPNNGKYRQFSEEDLENIWQIKVFVELGFSLVEIKDMMNNPDFDFRKSFKEKIEKMEAEKKRLEQLISLVKFIDVTGMIPSLPKKMGTIRFEDFIKFTYETLSVDADIQSKITYELVQFMLSKPDMEWEDKDIQQFLDKVCSMPEVNLSENDVSLLIRDMFLKQNLKASILFCEYCMELIALPHDDVSRPEVQEVIKKLYDLNKENFVGENADKVTPQWFAFHFPSFFVGSELAVLTERSLGKENCEFIAKAVVYFGTQAEEAAEVNALP